MNGHLKEMVDDLGELVTCESPSEDRDAVARSARVVADLGRRLLGTGPEHLVLDGRTHLRWRFGAGDKVLLLGHHDTVWPLGSLDRHPWRVAEGVAYGPGCYDMKAGLVQAFHALRSLSELDGVTILVTGDEELGAPSSRQLIREEARRSSAVLVFEGSAEGGALKTSRKGISLYQLLVRGRGAHAGTEPAKGINATVEVAHQVHALARLTDGSTGTTVTPTVLSAGTSINTVPEQASLSIDVRTRSKQEQARIDTAIRSLRPFLPGSRLEVVAGPSHPPLEPTASAALYELAERIAARSGMAPLGSASVGGASDGNLTAAEGTPTLDGLGAVGGNAHAPGEWVDVHEMPRRVHLIAGMVRALQGDPHGEPDAATE